MATEMGTVGTIVAVTNLLIGVVIVLLSISVLKKTKGSVIYWAALLYMFTAIMFVVHALVEVVFGYSDMSLYAVTALIATIMLAFTMIIIDISTRMLGVKI